MRCNEAIAYAERVSAGEIAANKWVLLACRRFLSDLDRELCSYNPYWFDKRAADAAVKFIEALPHTKGDWAGRRELLRLEPWQVFIVANIFGWRRVDGFRRFREALALIPRKNGKSILAAAIALYMFCRDGEFGAECYSGATSEKQAWYVFGPARDMVKRTPKLARKRDIRVNAKSLVIESNGSKFEPIIGNPGDGGSPHCAVIDEYHEHPDDRMVETMSTGMGARSQPLLLLISTAGADLGGPCKAKFDDCCKVLEGSAVDETTFCVMWGVDEDDQWDAVEALEKANPNLGVSVSRAYLLAQMEQARRSPTKQTAFRTKHLNCWVGAKTAWLNQLALQRCKNPDLNMADYHRWECAVGVDLATKIDMTSVCFLFTDGHDYKAFWRHYLPEETVWGSGNEKYRAWVETGWLTATPGEIVDYEIVEEDIKRVAREASIRGIGYDPHKATQFATRMMDEGFDLIEVRQTRPQLNEPMRKFEELVHDRRFEFNDPVASWMFGNVVASEFNDLMRPDKEKPENKIDGVTALLNALKILMVEDDVVTVGDVLVG